MTIDKQLQHMTAALERYAVTLAYYSERHIEATVQSDREALAEMQQEIRSILWRREQLLLLRERYVTVRALQMAEEAN